MAVNFAAAPTASNLAQPLYNSQYYGYPSQETSSDSSQTPSPNSFSPTSPESSHLANPLRQLRPPKKPLYVPAVLRPTERPSRNSPPSRAGTTTSLEPVTPPSSSGSSPAQGALPEEDEDTALRKFLGGGVVSGGVSRIVTDEWNEKKTEPVTGSPTKDHWKPDEAVSACDMSQCNLPFGLLRRRHHCRRCGNIFCADHARFQVPLDQHARFHAKGFQERACEACAKDFSFWQKAMNLKRRHSASDSMSTRNVTSSGSVQVPPGAEDKLLQEPTAKDAGGRSRNGDNIASSFVGSLGNFGNWSTF